MNIVGRIPGGVRQYRRDRIRRAKLEADCQIIELLAGPLVEGFIRLRL